MTPAPLIIAVDGRSGAGKTTLAVELAARLRTHHRVSLFHLEDIYPGWEGLEPGIARYVAAVLEPLRRGMDAHWHPWDWTEQHDGGPRITVSAPVIIVEGVGAAAAVARPFLDAVVWAESPADTRRTRALARDGASYEPFWDTWAAQEESWLAGDNVPAHADVVVQNGADGRSADDLLTALSYLPALAPALNFQRSARSGQSLAVEKIPGQPDAPQLFTALYGRASHAVWLDSSNAPLTGAEHPVDRNRFSIMADSGGLLGQVATHAAGTTNVTAGTATVTVGGPFFQWLDDAWEQGAPTQQLPFDFALGWLGWLGYELKRETGGSDVNSSTPDAALLFAARAVVLDHQEGDVWLLALEAPDCEEWLDTARSAVAAAASNATDSPGAATEAKDHSAPPSFTGRDTEQHYKDQIAAAHQEIANGNSYEICLTTALTATVPAIDPWSTYLALRRSSPAPFGSFLAAGSITVASTSPERFLQVAPDGGLRAEPIKGTRARGADTASDAELRADLVSSPKDRAENIMIVDLLRNDLSHFAVPGSVTVSRLCAIETYATVHQMVSTINAQLQPGASRAEAIAACFPAGSMTGAPKISTMAILDRLESGPRGVYSGAIGYFSRNGAADLAVAIRTLVIDQRTIGEARLSLGLGGAITADSVASDEYQEIRVKSRGVLSALGSQFPDT